jgi:hypothetical protein
MLDITIRIAKALKKYPTVHTKLRLMEQKWGRGCLCDSPAKMEKLMQCCGGSESATLGDLPPCPLPFMSARPRLDFFQCVFPPPTLPATAPTPNDTC